MMKVLLQATLLVFMSNLALADLTPVEAPESLAILNSVQKDLDSNSWTCTELGDSLANTEDMARLQIRKLKAFLMETDQAVAQDNSARPGLLVFSGISANQFHSWKISMTVSENKKFITSIKAEFLAKNLLSFGDEFHLVKGYHCEPVATVR